MKKSLRYNQNFFRDPRLVAASVAQTGIGKNDLVYEIGPGRGIITRELAKIAGKVVAVEIDRRLAERLRQDFSGNDKVKIINADWLDYRVPEGNYKIFSNIPFNLTAQVVRKIVDSPRPPRQSFLVVQKQAAEKFIGRPSSTQFSVSYQPWFEFKVVWVFKRRDFFPAPGVDAVLLSITKKEQSLVNDKQEYFYFVEAGFNRLKKLFTYRQWRRLARDLKFFLPVRPGNLSFDQWLGIFNFYHNVVK